MEYPFVGPTEGELAAATPQRNVRVFCEWCDTPVYVIWDAPGVSTATIYVCPNQECDHFHKKQWGRDPRREEEEKFCPECGQRLEGESEMELLACKQCKKSSTPERALRSWWTLNYYADTYRDFGSDLTTDLNFCSRICLGHWLIHAGAGHVAKGSGQ